MYWYVCTLLYSFFNVTSLISQSKIRHVHSSFDEEKQLHPSEPYVSCIVHVLCVMLYFCCLFTPQN